MPERRPVTEKTLKVSTSKSKGSSASHSSLAVFLSLVPPTGRSQHEPTDKTLLIYYRTFYFWARSQSQNSNAVIQSVDMWVETYLPSWGIMILMLPWLSHTIKGLWSQINRKVWVVHRIDLMNCALLLWQQFTLRGSVWNSLRHLRPT